MSSCKKLLALASNSGRYGKGEKTPVTGKVLHTRFWTHILDGFTHICWRDFQPFAIFSNCASCHLDALLR